MRALFIIAAICLGIGSTTPVQAGDPGTDARSVAGWEAVGRLNIGGRGMCTGALISPDTVLTAAHCLFDPFNGRPIDPHTIRFDAGLSGNTAKATRWVSRSILDPEYVHIRNGQAQLGHDLAVLKLDSPINGAIITPFQTDARPERGDAVGVISYTQDRANAPILQQPCQVLARQADTLVMNCEVEFGASGAPVFAVQGGAQPKLVSVISAKAAMGNRPVSVGTVLDAQLQFLLNRAG